MVAKSVRRAVTLLLLGPSAAFALGLGDIRLQSSLNSPLNAEIELLDATPEELASLRARIASRETFQRYGLDWPAFLSNVSVTAARTPDGRSVLRLRSNETIAEPFLTFLVEVDWARGRLLREYTVLLDPPVYTPGQTAGASAPVAAPAAGNETRTGAIERAPAPQRAPAPERSATREQPAARPEQATSATRAAPAPAATDGTYAVRPGDTLSAIAGRFAGGNTEAVRQWMVAVYQANPGAFDGNMNLLRSGAVLRVPDQAAVNAIGPNEALAEIRRQYAAWRGTASTAPAAAAADAGRLRLVAPTEAPSGGNLAPQPAGDVASLQNRIRELQAQLEESRRLMELSSAELARLQAQLSGQPSQQTPAAAAAPAESAATTEAGATGAETTAAAPAESEAPTAAQAESAAPAATAPEAPAAPATEAAPEESAPTVSLFDRIRDFWWVLALVVAGLLALLGVKKWRARRESEFDESLGRLATAAPAPVEPVPVRDVAPRAPSVAAAAAVPASAPARRDAFARDDAFLVEETGTHEQPKLDPATFSAAMPPHVQTDDTMAGETAINLEQGDPLAEADFHMAYGLYDQAADLVRLAVEREPGRRELKLKLLEIYFVWGNKEQFLQTARELSRTRASAAPGEWEKIVIMGKQLAPEDPLFSSGAQQLGAAAAGGVDLDLEGSESRVDFDLLGSAAAGNGLDLDIGSAFGDDDATGKNAALSETDTSLALHEQGFDLSVPGSGLSGESPTIEQPALGLRSGAGGTQKVQLNFHPGTGEQTTELAIDDLGLDLGPLDALEDSGVGENASPAAVMGNLDDTSRRLLDQTVVTPGPGDEAPTGSWDLDMDALAADAPKQNGAALRDADATMQLTDAERAQIDSRFARTDVANVADGNATMRIDTTQFGDGAEDGWDATMRISAEDLALPDLEPATMSEVGTKLDLARAYMDMGDPEGARSILEEVLQEGSVVQKQEAQRLLEALPG